MTQNSPASPTGQCLCPTPIPSVTLVATPDDINRFFANIVITGLPDPSAHQKAIDDILHAIRHYGAHGDSSGRKSSKCKVMKGEILENTEFRLAISYYFLPTVAEHLVIQITQNANGKALLLNETNHNPTTSTKDVSNPPDLGALKRHYAEFIASAPDEQTARFRRRVIESELSIIKERKKAQQAHDSNLPGRPMTIPEQREYFGRLTHMCYQRVAAYIEQTFCQSPVAPSRKQNGQPS